MYTNDEIRRESEVYAVEDKVEECMMWWLQHLQRMDAVGIPKQAFNYTLTGR